MGDKVESKPHGGDAHIEKAISQVDDVALDDNKQAVQNKAAAIEAENAEHNMGVPQAVAAYPMAALWAFIMSCTIVGRLSFLMENYS